MKEIQGLFEIAIPVTNLKESQEFYGKILGFEPGINDDERRWLFLYTPGRKGMVVLQETSESFAKFHFALKVQDLDSAAERLRDRGIVTSPVRHHKWMNAKSIYFQDPNGHDLEFISLNPGGLQIEPVGP